MCQGFEDPVFDVGEYDEILATYVAARRQLNDMRYRRGQHRDTSVKQAWCEIWWPKAAGKTLVADQDEGFHAPSNACLRCG